MPAHDPGEFTEKLLGALSFLGLCVKVLKVAAKYVAEYVEEAKEGRAKPLPESEECAEIRRQRDDAMKTGEELRAENVRLCRALETSDARAARADARAERLQEWIDARNKGTPPETP